MGEQATDWYATLGERLSDGETVWLIDSYDGSIAEMMCPSDVERKYAELIVKAVNAYDSNQATIAAQQEVIKEILAEAEFVDTAHAPFTTWVAEKCRTALELARKAQNK